MQTETQTRCGDDLPDLLTMQETAGILRCSRAHLSNVLGGKVAHLPPLPHVAMGRRKLIRRATLEAWLNQVEDSREGC